VLKQTVVQINEMQSAMREAAKQIEGSQEYIAKQMEIFRENEILKNAQKILEKQREEVANSFFGDSQAIQKFKIDASMKKMIEDAVKTSQTIEGYAKASSKQLNKEVESIMKMHNVQVSTQKDSENK
jgi:hypothetical protein